MRRVGCRPRRSSDAVTRPRSGTVTLPRFAIEMNIHPASRSRSTRRWPNVSCNRMRPGTRSLTRTPSRTCTFTRPARSGRVVNRTRVRWSPGSARGGRRTPSVTIALSPERSERRAGTIRSHVRGVTSTTTRSAPSFRTRILLEPGTVSASCAGETESATRGRAAPAPSAAGADAGTSMVRPARASAALTARPP
jgi:hypothetical protein